MTTAVPLVALDVRFNSKAVYDTAFLCENVAHALDDLTPVWTAFLPELRAALRRNFDQRQGSVDGPTANDASPVSAMSIGGSTGAKLKIGGTDHGRVRTLRIEQ